jgi:hypothetical protein
MVQNTFNPVLQRRSPMKVLGYFPGKMRGFVLVLEVDLKAKLRHTTLPLKEVKKKRRRGRKAPKSNQSNQD